MEQHQQQQKVDVSCTVLAVRNKPFAIPKALIHLPTQQGFGVKCEVADSATGTTSVLVTKTPPIDIHQQQQLIEQLQKEQQLAEAQGIPLPAASLSMEPSSMIIQKIPFQKESVVAWRLARFLRLSNLINPHLCPNVLPLIAAYRHQSSATTTSDNNSNSNAHSAIYVCQPHMQETLASAVRAAPTTLIQPNQIRTIARELLDAFSLLHKNNVVILDLNPTTIRVNLALKSRSDVAICLSRPVLGGFPLLSQHFLKLLDLPQYGHRYLAPEVIVQIVNATTSKAPATANTAVFTIPDTSSITVSTASDIWSLGCILAELALGRPLFPSETIYDHGKVVSQILSVNFPETNVILNQQVPAMIAQAQKLYGVEGYTTSLSNTLSSTMQQQQSYANDATLTSTMRERSPNQNSRIGVFNGIHVSSFLQTNLASNYSTSTANSAEMSSFRLLIAAMLQIDPALRPTAEDVIRSPFIAAAGGVGGGSGSGGVNVGRSQYGGGTSGTGGSSHGGGGTFGARVFGGRRNSGTSSSHSRPNATTTKQQQIGNTTTATTNAAAAATRREGGGGSADLGGAGLIFDFGKEWAIPSPTDNWREVFEELCDSAPVLP